MARPAIRQLPVVFFKLLLTGYLENITSDHNLVEHCSRRMDVLYFLGFDIDEELPWHSTISRTLSFTRHSSYNYYQCTINI
jgi:transposase